MKTCCICKLDKPFSEFYKNKRKKDGHEPRCKLCNSAMKAMNRKNNYERTNKVCPKCNIEKSYRLDFYPNAPYCKDCARSYHKQWYQPGEKHTLKQQSLKRCTNCKEVLDVDMFGGNGGGRRNPRCRPCHNELTKESRRRRNMMKLYGLTGEDYGRMSSLQSGRCKICNEESKLVIDHCHETGVVRGLLCAHCNAMLGFARDNVKFMLSGIEYLEVHSGRTV